MKSKRGFEFSFGWLFAVIVGAVIIFLGIYAATRIANTEEAKSQSFAAKEFSILTSSFETSLEEDRPDTISFPEKSILYSDCLATGNFGLQKLSSSNAKEKTKGIYSSFANKYFFSDKEITGKSFLVWSKPFRMPFKVADIMYIWSEDDKYCFIDTPQSIEEHLSALRKNNLILNKTISFASSYDKNEKCRGSLEVCFGGSINCDINVMENKVRKDGKQAYYGVNNEDYSLLYAAIFSDPDIYECQLKRLMMRSSNLALLYSAKSEMVGSKGCGSGLSSGLSLFAQSAASYKNSEDLGQILTLAGNLEVENEALSCPLF